MTANLADIELFYSQTIKAVDLFKTENAHLSDEMDQLKYLPAINSEDLRLAILRHYGSDPSLFKVCVQKCFQFPLGGSYHLPSTTRNWFCDIALYFFQGICGYILLELMTFEIAHSKPSIDYSTINTIPHQDLAEEFFPENPFLKKDLENVEHGHGQPLFTQPNPPPKRKAKRMLILDDDNEEEDEENAPAAVGGTTKSTTGGKRVKR